jgi:hypothetical protein
VLKVLLEAQVQVDQQVLKVHKVLKVLKVIKVTLVQEERQVLKVP